MAKRRRKKQSASPFLIVGLVSAAIILVMGFLILNKNNALFGPAKTEPTTLFTLPEGESDETLPLITSAGDPEVTSPGSTEPIPAEPTAAVRITDRPVNAPATPAPPAQPVVTPAPPAVTAAPLVVTAVPTNPPATPTPAPTPVPTAAGPMPVPLPLYYGRILPENEAMIIRDATPAQYTGAYVGEMVITEQNIAALNLSEADRTKMAQIAAEAGKTIAVDGSLSQSELILVASESALSRSDGTIRRIPLNVSNGEVQIAPVTPYIPGADAQIKVYFMAENVINYVYSERVVADADVLAWFEVRIEIVKTG